MEQYVWWEAPLLMREEWKYVLMELGEQCVLVTGISKMPLWCAVNLGMRLQVQGSYC